MMRIKSMNSTEQTFSLQKSAQNSLQQKTPENSYLIHHSTNQVLEQKNFKFDLFYLLKKPGYTLHTSAVNNIYSQKIMRCA